MEALGLGVSRVTASGVGEPLHAYAALAPFLAWCHERRTPASVTTSGGPLDRLETLLSRDPQNGVTISVHAGTEATRARMVPRGPALDPLFTRLGAVVPSLSRRRRKKLALAYLLIAGENDAVDELDAFAERARPLGEQRVSVHLFAHNPVPTSTLRGPSREAYEWAYERLAGQGLTVRMSSKARLRSNGGCGTLISARALSRSRDAGSVQLTKD